MKEEIPFAKICPLFS